MIFFIFSLIFEFLSILYFLNEELFVGLLLIDMSLGLLILSILNDRRENDRRTTKENT